MHHNNPAAAVSSCNSVSPRGGRMTIDDVSIGRNFFDAVFHFFFFLLCDMGFYYSLFYFTTRRGWESDSERRIRQRRHTTKQITPDPERPLRETRRDSELDRRSLNDYTNAREGRGRWEGGSKKSPVDRAWPRAPFSLRVFFQLSYFLIKLSSGFI